MTPKLVCMGNDLFRSCIDQMGVDVNAAVSDGGSI
jgi:hypothetical protein